jgi:hypothetical protein
MNTKSLAKESEKDEAAVAVCIKDMKRFVSASKGLTAVDVVDFCAGAQPNLYGYSLVKRTESVKVSGAFTQFDSPLAACYAAVSESSSKLNSGATQLTPRERLQLCANAPSIGPANCSYAISSRTGTGTVMHVLDAVVYSMLCYL